MSTKFSLPCLPHFLFVVLLLRVDGRLYPLPELRASPDNHVSGDGRKHGLYSGHRFGIAGRPVGVLLNCAPHKAIHRIKVRGAEWPNVGAGVSVEIGSEPLACYYGRMAWCRILLPNVRPPIGHRIVFTVFSEHIAAFRISAFVWPARTIITHVTRLYNSDGFHIFAELDIFYTCLHNF